METIKNKQSKLFNGISVDEIEKLMEKYRSYSLSKVQSIEDEFCEMLIELIRNETHFNLVEEDKYWDEIMEVMSVYNWESRFGLDEGIDMVKIINNLNKH